MSSNQHNRPDAEEEEARSRERGHSQQQEEAALQSPAPTGEDATSNPVIINRQD